MVISKFLRPQQRVEQVHHNQRTDEKQDERLYIHEILLLHAIAEPHVSNRSGEKCDGDCDPKNILHRYLLGPTTVLLPRVRWPFAHQFLPVVCGFYSRVHHDEFSSRSRGMKLRPVEPFKAVRRMYPFPPRELPIRTEGTLPSPYQHRHYDSHSVTCTLLVEPP